MVYRRGRSSNNGVTRADKEWRVAYTNVNGLLSALNEINDYLMVKEPDIMALVETKLSEEIMIPMIGGGKYRTLKRNRIGKKGGGIMFIVKSDMIIEGTVVGEDKAEVLKISVKTKQNNQRDFAVAYVPPKTNAWHREEHDRMLTQTLESLERVVESSENLVLMGDFNCKEVCWEEWYTDGGEETWGARLLNLVMENAMTQWVKEKTRYQCNEEPSRLDLVLTKEIEVVKKVEYKCPINKSDHVVIELELAEYREEDRNEEHRVGRYSYGKTDFNGLRKFFERGDWSKFETASNIQEKWQEFIKMYEEGIEKYVPKIKENKKKKKEWFNRKCEECRRKKEEAWNKLRKGRNNRVDLWERYKTARNEYVRIRREEKINYEKNVIEKCKEEPKLFYRFINGKLKSKEGISNLKVDGVIYEDAYSQAEIFNKSFQSVFTKESSFVESCEVAGSQALEKVEVDVAEVKKIMETEDVRKCPGPDGVSNWILRECSDQLADKIHSIIVMSLRDSRVPKEWKKANITPIYKGGSKEDPLNYRPVSLTSVVAKICEKVVKVRWMNFLEENKLISEKQFGFRKGRSCMTSLISFYSRVIDEVQERDGWVDCVYLDLKKAFDKVPHKRLVRKLEYAGGIKGGLLKWMKDYLVGREMRTTVRGVNSDWCSITSGVPQGSVLAPIMFMVYINDIVEGVNSYMNLFADDAKLLRRVKKREDGEMLQKDLDNILEWSHKWEMEFNVKKCKVMEFGKGRNRTTSNYCLGNTQLSKTKQEKDLGVIIQDNLTPERHINKITGEAYNLIRNIKAAFTYMDEEMMKKLIVSMIRPKLEYAAVVWSPHKKKDIRKIERIQRAATKMVPTLRDLPYEERLERLNLQTLEKRRERGDLIAIYRASKELEKVDRSDLFLWDVRNTRGHGKKLKMDGCRRDIKKFSFPQRSIEVWNKLDTEIVQAKSISEFKAKLDKSRYGDGTVRA